MTDSLFFVLGPALSRRQCEVLSLAARGWTDAEIAGELVVSVYTVREHLERARARLNARNTTHAVAMALTWGLIRIDMFSAGEPIQVAGSK